MLFVLPMHCPLDAAQAEDIVFESHELKIVRTLSRNGTPVLMLTNIDADGNPLAGSPSPAGPGPLPCAGPHADRGEAVPGSPVQPASGGPSTRGSIRVVVNRGAGADPPDEREVEVTTDGSGAATVIINVEAPPAPEKEAPVSPAQPVYPVFVTGGLVGAYRYPAHLPFLGYGPDTSSPSWFGGLGLNSGNGFGLSKGVPCTQGFDCMFGPRLRRP